MVVDATSVVGRGQSFTMMIVYVGTAHGGQAAPHNNRWAHLFLCVWRTIGKQWTECARAVHSIRMCLLFACEVGRFVSTAGRACVSHCACERPACASGRVSHRPAQVLSVLCAHPNAGWQPGTNEVINSLVTCPQKCWWSGYCDEWQHPEWAIGGNQTCVHGRSIWMAAYHMNMLMAMIRMYMINKSNISADWFNIFAERFNMLACKFNVFVISRLYENPPSYIDMMTNMPFEK